MDKEAVLAMLANGAQPMQRRFFVVEQMSFQDRWISHLFYVLFCESEIEITRGEIALSGEEVLFYLTKFFPNLFVYHGVAFPFPLSQPDRKTYSNAQGCKIALVDKLFLSPKQNLCECSPPWRFMCMSTDVLSTRSRTW